MHHSTWHSGWHIALIAATAMAGAILGISVADIGNAVLRLVLALFVLILLARQLHAH